jgi:two-component system, NtrC family, response regulator AtoC
VAQILVIEDEARLRSSIRQSLELDGHHAGEAGSIREALEQIEHRDYDAAIVDLNLMGESGMDLIRRLRADGWDGLIMVVTAHGTVETAIEAIKAGADEFIQKPVRLDELSVVVTRGLEHRRLKNRLDVQERIQRVASDPGEVLGESAAWTRTLSLSRRFAALPIPREGDPSEPPTILLLGETGSGKGAVAQYVHSCCARAPGNSGEAAPPFVHVNCAALPASLIESELFGHERGAFTDAKQGRAGLFELAEGGTIFLDEIGEIPLEMQSKLLVVVERGLFRRIGGTRERRVRARIIAASNQDLDERVRVGSFRRDLLFRLNALTIRIPALRERGEDAVLIADRVLERLGRQYGRSNLRLTDDARRMIRAQAWPGNVRELINVVRRAAILCDEPVVSAEHLGLTATMSAGAMQNGSALMPAGMNADNAVFDFTQGPIVFDELERRLIAQALKHARGNVSLAAKLIGLNRGALRYRIERLGLEPQTIESGDS